MVRFNADEVIPAEAIGAAVPPPTEASSVSSVTSESKILDSSIQSPVDKDDKKLEDLKKSIQAKVKKLRRLKQEARQIEAQLRKERKIKALEGVPPENQAVVLQKWKNRMRRRVKAILKKVNKMEKQMKNKKAHIRKRIEKLSTLPPPEAYGINMKKHKKHERKMRKNKSTTMVNTFTTTLAPTTIVQSPITKKVVNKVKRSHKGENGDHCETHKDCAPGHCCHRFGLSGKSVCIKHELNPGSPCTNSCACAGGMKCVKFHNFKTSPEQEPQCRQLTPDQLAHLSKSIHKPHQFRIPLHF